MKRNVQKLMVVLSMAAVFNLQAPQDAKSVLNSGMFGEKVKVRKNNTLKPLPKTKYAPAATSEKPAAPKRGRSNRVAPASSTDSGSSSNNQERKVRREVTLNIDSDSDSDSDIECNGCANCCDVFSEYINNCGSGLDSCGTKLANCPKRTSKCTKVNCNKLSDWTRKKCNEGSQWIVDTCNNTANDIQENKKKWAYMTLTTITTGSFALANHIAREKCKQD